MHRVIYMENTTKLDYSDFVATLAKPGIDILNSLTAEKCHLWHMATGIAGEGGELLDAVKRIAAYGQELDTVQKDGKTIRENIKEELGDLEFFMEGVRQIIGVTREEVLDGNYGKLGKRYEGLKYSDQAAKARADKEIEPLDAGGE